MKRFPVSSWVLGALIAAGVFFMVLWLPGGAPATAGASLHENPWSFNQRRGIRLGEDIQRALNIAMADAEITVFRAEPAWIPAQVIRVGDGQAIALARMPAGHAESLQKGLAVQAQVEEQPVEGEVIGWMPAGAEELELEVRLLNSLAKLLPGRFVQVRLPVSPERSGVLTVPAEAVIASVRGPFVYVRNGPEFLRNPVRIGDSQAGRVEIIDGLFEGDEVVGRGAADLWMLELQAVNGGKGCADHH